MCLTFWNQVVQFEISGLLAYFQLIMHLSTLIWHFGEKEWRLFIKSSVSECISNLIWFQSTVGAVDLGYVYTAVTKAGWISPSESHSTVAGVLWETSLFKIGLDISALQSRRLHACSVDMPLGLWMHCEGGAEQKLESLATYKAACHMFHCYCLVYMFLKWYLGYHILDICINTLRLDSEMSSNKNSRSSHHFQGNV